MRKEKRASEAVSILDTRHAFTSHKNCSNILAVYGGILYYRAAKSCRPQTRKKNESSKKGHKAIVIIASMIFGIEFDVRAWVCVCEY